METKVAWLGLAVAVTLLVAGVSLSAEDGSQVSTAQAGEPRGVHLSWADDPQSTLTVTWFTNGTTDPGTVVQYGTTAELGRQVIGKTHKAPGVDALVHEATMTGLEPGQTVFYRVGSEGNFSQVFEAKTAPADEQYSFLLFGDNGISPEAQEFTTDIINEVESGEIDFILIAGDLSYADGDQPEWDEWFDQIEPYASKVPIMAAPGNHELESIEPDGPETTAPFVKRMSLPGEELYYSFDIQNTHFLVLASDEDQWDRGTPSFSQDKREVDFRKMVEFARADLQQATERRDAGELDHIFVLQHHQLWSNHCSFSRQVNRDLIPWEEPLLQTYNVDMVLVGHNHHYERTYPMVYGQRTTDEQSEYEDPEGYIEVISGGAGRSRYCFQQENRFYPFSAENAKQYHYTRMDVNGSQVDVEAIASVFLSGKTLDQFSLDNDAEPVTAVDQDVSQLSDEAIVQHLREPKAAVGN